MDEEGVGFFAVFGGGISTLLTIAIIVMAVNNPTASDFKTEVAMQIQQEYADNSNPFFSMLSQQIGMIGADTLSIKSTNYIVLTHFEVVTPDARLFGGPASEQLCVIGVMNNFYQCESVPFFGNQPQQAPSAQEVSQSELDMNPGEASASQASVEEIDRPQGWLCDGVRVSFREERVGNTSSMVYPYRVTIAGQNSAWDSTYGTCGQTCLNGPSQVFTPQPGSKFGDAEFVKDGDLYFNDRICAAVK